MMTMEINAYCVHWHLNSLVMLFQPPDVQTADCSTIDNGVLPALECPDLCNNECLEMSSYCDCGSATCQCKAGFYGENCSGDLCAAARCEHGTCSAKYLGGELPVTSHACICEEGWSGPNCQHNPCSTLNKDCGAHGTCIALSDIEAECICDAGFSGDECTENCEDVCIGSYPFGCATNLNDVVRYGCHSGGGCSYLKSGEKYPFNGFCTYKVLTQQIPCICGDDNDCELSRLCNEDGTCATAGYFL